MSKLQTSHYSLKPSVVTTRQFSPPLGLAVLTFNLKIFLGLTNSFSEINSFLNKRQLDF